MILSIILVVLVRAWALMIALGMLAGYTGIAGLAIGFFPALALGFLLRVAVTVVNPNNNK
jgi:hypothetical protein